MKKRKKDMRTEPRDTGIDPAASPIDSNMQDVAPHSEPLIEPTVSSQSTLSVDDEDYSSTPSREVTRVSDFWRFLGLFGVCLLLASVIMWLWNTVSLTAGAREIETAFQADAIAQRTFQAAQQHYNANRHADTQRAVYLAAQEAKKSAQAYDAALKEHGQEPFRWMMVLFWGVVGYGCMLAHAFKEQGATVGKAYGLGGLGFLTFGALYLAYVIGFETQGMPLGLIAAGILGLLLLGLFLMPLTSHPEEEENPETAQNVKPLRIAFIAGMAMVILLILACFAHDALHQYAVDVKKLKENTVLSFGLLPWGSLWLLLGFGLALVYTAQKAPAEWQEAVMWPVLAVGGIAATAGLGTALTGWAGSTPWVLPYGVGFGCLGLLVFGATLAVWPDERGKVRFAWITVLAGAVTLVLSMGRSLEPVMREYLQPEQSVTGFFVPHGFVLIILSGLFMLLGLALAWDNRFVAMVRREIASLFYSPIAYICLAGLGLFGWLSYVQWTAAFDDSPMMTEPIVGNYMQGFYILFGMMVTLPMFTMRLLSEERRSGTLEMMLTAPVSEAKVVLSKFLGIWLFSLLGFGLWTIFPVLLRYFGQEEFDFRPLMSFYLCLACALAQFLAMGLFFSSLTRSQIVAFLLALTGMFLLLLPAFMVVQLRMEMSMGRPVSQTAYQIYLHLSYIDHLMSALSGRVTVRHLIFHLSACVFWLFITVKVLEARKWH